MELNTKGYHKLTTEMMLAIAAPYISAALLNTDEVEVKRGPVWLFRSERARADDAVVIKVPAQVRAGTDKRPVDKSVLLLLFVRDDSLLILTWEVVGELPDQKSTSVKAAMQRRLKRAGSPTALALAKEWGPTVAVGFSPQDFGKIVESVVAWERP